MGRLPLDLNAEIVRPLCEDDMAKLAGAERGIQPLALKRLSERHHALARCLADGRQAWEAAIMCSYSPSRVSILLGDPTFQNLVAYYREDIDRMRTGIHEKMNMATHAALDEALERFEDDDERKRIRFDQLLEMMKTGADRTGHGPTSTSVSLTGNIGEELDAARRARVARMRALEPSVYGTLPAANSGEATVPVTVPVIERKK